jgi:hypothetical protein
MEVCIANERGRGRLASRPTLMGCIGINRGEFLLTIDTTSRQEQIEGRLAKPADPPDALAH